MSDAPQAEEPAICIDDEEYAAEEAAAVLGDL